MKLMKRSAFSGQRSACAWLLLAAWPLAAQTNMRSTTLAAPVAPGDLTVQLTATTGVTSRTITTTTMLFVDREAMRVGTVAGNSVTVLRGTDGTPVTGHAAGATVWIGPPDSFARADPSGACTAALERFLPRIALNATVWELSNGAWAAIGGFGAQGPQGPQGPTGPQGPQGPAGTGGGGSVDVLKVERYSATEIRVGQACAIDAPCNVRIGATVYTFTSNTLKATAAAGSGTVRIGIDVASGGLIAWHDLSGLTCSGGVTCTAGAGSWPTDAIPLGECTVTASAVTECADKRALYSRDPTIPGWGLQKSGNVVSVATSLVPPWSSGAGAPTADCTPLEFYLRTGTSQVYACTATNTWTALN